MRLTGRIGASLAAMLVATASQAACTRPESAPREIAALAAAVNRFREAEGLAPLGTDPALAQAAEAHACLDCGCSRIVELHTGQIPGQHLFEFLEQCHLDRGREVMTVHQRMGVPGYGFTDLRVAVPQAGDVDSRGEVKVGVTVYIGEAHAVPLLEHHWEETDLAGVALHQAGGPSM